MALESNFAQQIDEYLAKKGAYVVNIHGNEFCKGKPDRLVGYRGRFLGLEFKQPDGSISSLQRRNLRQIQAAGCIGEAVRSRAKVQRIIESIDKGIPWQNTPYPHVRRPKRKA